MIETDHIRETRSGEGRKMVNQYEMKQLLGKGQHGEVWWSSNTLTGEDVVRARVAGIRLRLALTVAPPTPRPSKP